MATTDSNWAFSMAYNAILQATHALMFAKGFQPASGPAQHKTVVLIAETTLVSHSRMKSTSLKRCGAKDTGSSMK
ncbi:MAG: hypothetical protein ABSA71_16335 [Desulfomonilia bacterium]|jgi:uncharacterized protein (UPF0332 family)